MKKNLGANDRNLRFLFGIILLGIGLFASYSTLKTIVIIFGAIGIIESIVGYCYLYELLKINTYKGGRRWKN